MRGAADPFGLDVRNCLSSITAPPPLPQKNRLTYNDVLSLAGLGSYRPRAGRRGKGVLLAVSVGCELFRLHSGSPYNGPKKIPLILISSAGYLRNPVRYPKSGVFVCVCVFRGEFRNSSRGGGSGIFKLTSQKSPGVGLNPLPPTSTTGVRAYSACMRSVVYRVLYLIIPHAIV